MKRDILIIVSVPLSRNIRFLLSSKIYERIRREYAVLIVSPFADEEQFQKEFGGESVAFLRFENNVERLNKIVQKLYCMSESLRFVGYWYRYRKDKMRYHWNEAYQGRDRSTRGISGAFRAMALKYVVGPIGRSKRSWRLLDALFGKAFYDEEVLLQHTTSYKKVIVVQTANWGYQERYLAYCTRRLGFKSILLPYTTDQLSTNGHLISDFDIVCVQGPVEDRYAIEYHGVPERNIRRFGMLWMRNIEDFLPRDEARSPRSDGEAMIILYAGVSPEYFPRESELGAVRKILEAIDDGTLPRARVVYRPVASSLDEYERIRAVFADEARVSIDIPRDALIGMDRCLVAVSFRGEVQEYLRMMASVDVLVMSRATTLLFDALYLGVPSILNFCDPTSFLMNGLEGDLLIKSDPLRLFSSGIPVAFSFENLVFHIGDAMRNIGQQASVRDRVLGAWDYPNGNYVDGFADLCQQLVA